jgi:hypothetical protein
MKRFCATSAVDAGKGLVAMLCVLGPLHAQAQTVDEMRDELKRLRAEVNELRRDKASGSTPTPTQMPSDIAAWGERIKSLEAQAKTAVVSDGTGSGMRLPGSNTSLRIYGLAEAHVVHDFKQSGSPDVFTDLTFQPLDNAGGQRGKTKLTAQTSRLGFETSTPIGANTLTTKVEADFYSYGANNRNRLRLRQAYGEYGGWLVGQTWSTFMDLDNLPETVDFNGPIGAPFSRRTMLRYAFGDAVAGLKFTLAVEDPEDQAGGASANERIPQLVARADKKFGNAAVNARVLMHEKRSFSQTKRGYGVGLGANYKLSDKDQFMGQYTRVDGDVDQLYGSNGYTVDANTGNITFDKNQGLVLGYARGFSEQLRGSVVLGLNRGKTAQSVDNKQVSQWFFNLIYTPIKNVELGGEFIYGKRKTFTDNTGTLSRFDVMVRYSF